MKEPCGRFIVHHKEKKQQHNQVMARYYIIKGKGNWIPITEDEGLMIQSEWRNGETSATKDAILADPRRRKPAAPDTITEPVTAC